MGSPQWPAVIFQYFAVCANFILEPTLHAQDPCLVVFLNECPRCHAFIFLRLMGGGVLSDYVAVSSEGKMRGTHEPKVAWTYVILCSHNDTSTTNIWPLFFKYSKLLNIIQPSRIAFSKIVFRDTHMVIGTPMGSSPPRVRPRVISIYGHARCISVFSLPLRNTGEWRRRWRHGCRYCLDSPAVIHHPSLCLWTLAILWSVKGSWL